MTDTVMPSVSELQTRLDWARLTREGDEMNGRMESEMRERDEEKKMVRIDCH